MNLPEVFERYRAAIDGELRVSLEAHTAPLYDMLRYHLGWIDAEGHAASGSSGKALRPTLCLLACEAAGADFRRALPAAASVELVHNFSLIHDDIQDGDVERRHRPTVWSIWGQPQAINAGTAMHVVANLALRRLRGHGVPADVVIEAQQMLDQSCLRLIEGQYLDLSFESRLDIGVADYIAMIEGKTAELLACAVQLGAMVGTTDQALIAALRTFGWNLGMAFQIRDDVLGIWGDEAQTGKATGSDIRRKKKTLPIVYALEHAKGASGRVLLETYQAEIIDERGLRVVLAVLEEVGARAAAEEMAARYQALATSALATVALPAQARADLEQIGAFLTSREF